MLENLKAVHTHLINNKFITFAPVILFLNGKRIIVPRLYI